MSGFVGADVDQLMALSKSFARKADELDRIAATSTGFLMVAEWLGGDIDSLRSEWRTKSKPALQRAALELKAVAADIRKQAEQQRAASAAPVGVVPSWGNHPTDGQKAPASARDRFDMAQSAKEDGVRVQAIRGDDGVTRYVVYLRGTDPNSNGLWSISDNSSELGASTYTGEYIKQKMHELIPEGSEVMIVGYSQGGIYAQKLATDSRFKVTDIMTFGSPYYDNAAGSTGVNIVRVNDFFDAIPHSGDVNQSVTDATSIIDAAGTAWRSIFGDDAGAVAHRVDQLNADARHMNVLTTAPDVTPTVGGLGTHTDARTYEQGADQFEYEAQQSGNGRAILASQERYEGTIVADTGGTP